MTQAAHTPGPWVHDEDCAGRILGPDGVAVCAVYGSMARAQEDDCNQRLIAAAPELLAALEAVIDDLVCTIQEVKDNGGSQAWVDGANARLANARAAIAKAKGASDAD